MGHVQTDIFLKRDQRFSLFSVVLQCSFESPPMKGNVYFIIGLYDLLCSVEFGESDCVDSEPKPFDILTSNSQRFSFLSILANICYLFFFFIDNNHPMSVRWYLLAVFICIFLMSNDVENLFTYLLVIPLSLFKHFIFRKLLIHIQLKGVIQIRLMYP